MYVDSSFPISSKTVLWDIHHGSDPDCLPTEIFTHLFEILAEEGVSIQVSNIGILNEDLSQFHGIIIDACNV
jgi:hypothetical protein